MNRLFGTDSRVYVTKSLLIFVAVLFGAACGAQDTASLRSIPTFPSIEHAWMERQHQISSLDLHMQSIQFTSAMARTRGTRPEGDVTSDGKSRIILDSQGHVRFDSSSKVWSARKKAFVDQVLQQVWANGIETLVEVVGASDFPGAQITPMRTNPGLMTQLRPILMVCRGADDELRFFNPKEPINVDRGPLINGLETVSITQSKTNGKQISSRTVIVDAKRGYLPLRYERRIGKQLRSSIEIEQFENYSESIWIPMKWKVVSSYSKLGEPISSESVTVTSYEINRPIDAALFKLTIPEGAWVNNFITKEKYIQKSNGEKREILAHEYDGTNYSELLNSESGEAVGAKALSKESSTKIWLWVLNLIVIALLCAYIVHRRWRASAQ